MKDTLRRFIGRRCEVLIAIGLAIALAIAAGCARTPPGVNSNNGAQLIVTMTMAGPPLPPSPQNDYYFVLFNAFNGAVPNPGPVPLVSTSNETGQPNWFNGFGAGQFTAYVEINNNLPSTYLLYQAIPGVVNTPPTPGNLIGPVTVLPPPAPNTLAFQIPVSDLATSTIPVSQLNAMQINMIAQNSLPLGTAGANQTKLFDALGESNQQGGLDQPFTFTVQQAATYSNQNTTGLASEIANDVMIGGSGNPIPDNDSDADPNYAAIDIVGWSVTVSQ